MIPFTPVAALLTGLALAGPGAGHDVSAGDSIASAPLDVPFVAQDPLLCGGAAAAMVERFWGARDVYAEDFASLVHPREGGIRGSDLAAALVDHGYRVNVYQDDPAILPREIGAGVPVVVLMDGGLAAFHYVVVVGWGPSEVVVHDPAYGPDRTIPAAEFRERWARADEWTMVVRPGRAVPAPATPTMPIRPSADSTGAGAPGIIGRGIDEIRRGDLAAARSTARRALAEGNDSALAWRLLATARYLNGDADGALRAWNRVGGPRLDLLRIEGLHRTRYPLVARLLLLRHGRSLTPGDLRLARRRLRQVPTISRARVDYRALGDGSVEATAHVLERPMWPTGRIALSALVLDAAVNQHVELEAGPFLGAGDRLAVAARWGSAFQAVRVGARALAPPAPGVVEIALGWRRARLASSTGSVRTDERLHAGVELQTWLHPRLRIDGSLGLERWRGHGRLGTAGAALHLPLASDRMDLTVTAQEWAGASATFGRTSMRLRARIPRGSYREWRLDVGGAWASAGTPPLAWWGAGAGRVGEVLLRGHPLVADGAITGPVFGRGLAHASVEHAVLFRFGPARLGGSAFVDVARGWKTLTRDVTPVYADVGTGLRAELGERRFRLDLARGGGRWVLSAQAASRIP